MIQKTSYEIRDISSPPSPSQEMLYRCEISVYEYGTSMIQFETYPVTKHTNQGVWVDVYGHKKFVLLNATKQWACRTKQAALTSFIKRKESQIKILSRQLEYANRQLQLAKEFKL